MKKLIILLISLIFSISSMAGSLFILPTGSIEKTKAAFAGKDIIVHYYNDHFIIGSTDGIPPANSILLDGNAWSNPSTGYYLLYFQPGSRTEYRASVIGNALLLHETDEFMVVSVDDQKASLLFPAIHGGMICIKNQAATFPPRALNYKPGTLVYRDYIDDMLTKVNTDSLEAYVQHLQDFGTRNAYKQGSIDAQNWILAKLESYGLSVELHDFYMPSGPASDNVIATLTGTLYPDEYVVLGAHYDSYAGGNNEPGADDNATGTAGILEAARIMSQYQFDRSIIFATWSGEEYGLYGSEAWASEAAQEGMNILGYFNIDMAGYLEPGDEIHTDIIAPASAIELREFYKDVCEVYLPGFQTYNGALSGGDSDHTSFNNNGYQGIFPFEDSQNYSPYIHTTNDIIGPSVNNFEQHMTFVQATIASVATLSGQLPYPENLVAMAGDMTVELSWDSVEGATYYNVYRNLWPEPFAVATEPQYIDNEVENGMSYTYYVTAYFEDSGEESTPSNEVTVIPMPPIALPFFDDFETGAPYWTMEDTWGLQSGTYYSSEYALTESPSGDYQANMEMSSTLRALNFTGAASAQLSFWTKHSLENDYDFVFLEISTNGIDWEELDVFNGIQSNWIQKTYSLNEYLEQTSVIIRFRFTSDVYVEYDGIYIDDFEVFISGIGINDDITSSYKTSLQFNPNPASNAATLKYWLENSGQVKITLADPKGNIVKTLVDSWKETGSHEMEISTEDLSAGMYYGILEINGQIITRKLAITR